MMDTYVRIFMNFIMVIDVILVCVLAWCLIINAKELIFKDQHSYDRPFRGILLLQCMNLLHGNQEALQRHLKLFLFTANYTLSPENADSLLSDRWGMLLGGMCCVLFTLKWIPEWFKKLLK